jgi:ribosomal protein S27AE
MENVVRDGQQLLLPTSAEWADLLTSRQLQGRPLPEYFVLAAEHIRQFIQRYPEFLLLILNLDNRLILPCLFLRTKQSEQRVTLERLRCSHCGWQGQTANPSILDNYLGLPSAVWTELLTRATNLPRLNCPRCAAFLPRHAIWVEY